MKKANIFTTHTLFLDGVFWMSFQDFINTFDTVCVARIFNDFLFTSSHSHLLPISMEETQLNFPDTLWHRIKFEGNWNDQNCGGLITSKSAYGMNPHLKLTVFKSGRYFIHINREGLDPNADAQYYRTAIGFVVYMGHDKKYLDVPKQMTTDTYIQYPSFSRFNSVELELEPGEYVVTCCTLYPNQKGKFWFEVYGQYEFDCASLSDSVNFVQKVPGSARNNSAKNYDKFKEASANLVEPFALKTSAQFTLTKPPTLSSELRAALPAQENNSFRAQGTGGNPNRSSYVFNSKTLTATERVATPKFMTTYSYEFSLGRNKM